MSSSFSIRAMKETDISAADSLRDAAGWNQTRADWERTILYEPTGCFVAIAAEEVVGTVTTTTYGSELGWIGMMLVREDFRRRGIATALMTHAINYLNSRSIKCIKLDATPAGLPVYERLGFRAEWQFHRWAHPGNEIPENAAIEQPNGDSFYPGDRRAFGVDRSDWLRHVAADSVVINRVEGFGMLRPGRKADYLGPVSAATLSAAEQIIGQLLGGSAGSIFWDIPSPNEDALVMATALGFAPFRELTRMWTGQNLIDVDLRMQYALSDPGMG